MELNLIEPDQLQRAVTQASEPQHQPVVTVSWQLAQNIPECHPEMEPSHLFLKKLQPAVSNQEVEFCVIQEKWLRGHPELQQQEFH